MSEVFEGVIAKVPAATVRTYVEAVMPSLHLDIYELVGELSVVYSEDSRAPSGATDDMRRLAKILSEKFTLALLVRYDSRIGHRSSDLYSNGSVSKQFGERDELYVPLDENGEPVVTHAPLKHTDLITGEEYETVQNAIELGFIELGGGNWLDLKRLIARV